MSSHAPVNPTMAYQPPRRARGAKVLAIVGGVILVLSVVAVVVGVALISDSADDFGDTTSGTRSRLLGEFELPGRAEVRLTPGRYYVYAIDPVDLDDPVGSDDLTTSTSLLQDDTDGTGPGTGTDRTRRDLDVTATVTGPDGGAVPTDPPGASAVFHGLADGMEVVRQFRVTETGTYVVAATGADAPRAGVGRATDLGRAVGEVLGGGVLTVAGGFGAFLGGALLLAGVIWLLTSKPGPTAPPGGFGSSPPGAWSGPGAAGPGGWAPPAGPSWTPPPAPPPPADQPPPTPQGPVS